MSITEPHNICIRVFVGDVGGVVDKVVVAILGAVSPLQCRLCQKCLSARFEGCVDTVISRD